MRILVTILVLSLLPACYFGRSRTAKHGAYVANGTAIVIGSVLVADAVSSNNRCSNSELVTDCTGAGAFNAVQATLGAIVAAIGVIGVGVNAAIPTQQPPEPRQAVTGQVTAPGLKPATIHLP